MKIIRLRVLKQVHRRNTITASVTYTRYTVGIRIVHVVGTVCGHWSEAVVVAGAVLTAGVGR
jgi:hypothetical protein